ncbi:hypothetical protein ACVNIS_03470 [Sphaerotilaceae bacterium SBD11-9]
MNSIDLVADGEIDEVQRAKNATPLQIGRNLTVGLKTELIDGTVVSTNGMAWR